MHDLSNSFNNTWKESKWPLVVLLFSPFMMYCIWIQKNQILWLVLTVLFIILFIFQLLFFRDPERRVPVDETAILAPADGKVIGIENRAVFPVTGMACQRMDIFLSLHNVHINRSPAAGRVTHMHYSPGKFYAAFQGKASALNEHLYMVIETDWGYLGIKQIAGFLARRIVNYQKIGDQLKMGQRFGMIKFGSRIELFLPENVELNVRYGQAVKGGVTIIGRSIRV